MRSILITGATTPLGEALVRRLCADPTVSSVLAIGREAALKAGCLNALGKVTYRPVDLRRVRQVRTLLFGEAERLGVDTVIHLAMHRAAKDEGSSTFRLNVDSTRELLALCEHHPKIRRFVFRSVSEVYEVRPHRSVLIAEDNALNLSRKVPQWIRDRVAADLMVCMRMGMSDTQVAVVRTAEVLAPGVGSQLWDYLQSRVCLLPLGFDPMLNLLSLDDAATALHKAALSEARGLFNIPGADTLPLSELATLWGRTIVALPGPALKPLYRLRARLSGTDFRYDLNFWRFHFSGILDGTRAARVLDYTPAHPLYWPG